MSGYVFVDADYETICQTIKQKKFVTASFAVSTDWFKGIITKVLKIIGRHYVILKGFKISEKKLKGQNSWGIAWIGYIAGKFDSRIQAGCFEMLWDDYQDKIYDIIAFSYIPPEIKEVTKYGYRFMTTLKLGSNGYEVKKLQERLAITADGSFGKGTQKAVINFQIKNGLLADGVVGYGTRKALNIYSKSLIEVWAKAIQSHEGYYKGSRSYRNNNPANFKSGTLTSFMKSLGATGVDSGGFCIFPSYEIGFKALCNFLEMACKDKLASYQSGMTLLQFYNKYAPSSDGNNTLAYAKTVAKAIGGTINTKIVELLPQTLER
jgi:peptidoglycan hydrolase-like protein with peptidoglycan-binding domain